MGRRQGEAIAGYGQKQGGRQHLPAFQAIAEKAHQEHGGRLSQGGDAGRQSQCWALHRQGLACLHQGGVGHARVDQLQAGQNPEVGHRQGARGFGAQGSRFCGAGLILLALL